MELELKKLEDLAEAIVSDFAYMKSREKLMRDTNGEFKSFMFNQSQNAKRASSQKRHIVISTFLPCNSLILMSIGAGSIRAI